MGEPASLFFVGILIGTLKTIQQGLTRLSTTGAKKKAKVLQEDFPWSPHLAPVVNFDSGNRISLIKIEEEPLA